MTTATASRVERWAADALIGMARDHGAAAFAAPARGGDESRNLEVRTIAAAVSADGGLPALGRVFGRVEDFALAAFDGPAAERIVSGLDARFDGIDTWTR